MTAFFITGTDTDAGKTHVSRALLMAARTRGLRVAGYKPIESGCPEADMPGLDAQSLGEAGGHAPITTYRFGPAISPHLAAARAGVEIDMERIVDQARKLDADHDIVLVEGAGGLLVPISETESMADLATRLALPMIIVAADRLGSMNHSLLTLEAARHRGLDVAALVLSETRLGSGRGLENAAAIRAHGHVNVHAFVHNETARDMILAGAGLLDALLADAEA